MYTGRKVEEDEEVDEEEMEGYEFDEEVYDDEDYDQEYFEEEGEDPCSIESNPDRDSWTLSEGPSPEKLRKCDPNQNCTRMLSGSVDGGHDSSLHFKPQDADYLSLSQRNNELGSVTFPVELETMILARVAILEFRKLCSLNKRYLSLVKGGGLLEERKMVGAKEATVFMLASGEDNWQAFDQRFTAQKALPVLPCDEAFKFGDKESLCARTHLLVCGYSIDGAVIWTYDVLLNKWQKGSSMVEPRCLFASASCGEFAFVAGGIGLKNNEILCSAERYDPYTKSWDLLPRMKERRKMCSGVYLDNKFYVLGGQNENGDVLTCAEMFLEERNMWVKIPGMLNGLTLATSQSPPLVGVVENELYFFESSSNCLMVYIKKTKSWKNLGSVPVRADINKGWGVAFKSLGNELLVIGCSTISRSGRGMSIYTCCPNPKADELKWKPLGGGCGNCRSHFIMNCTVMVA